MKEPQLPVHVTPQEAGLLQVHALASRLSRIALEAFDAYATCPVCHGYTEETRPGVQWCDPCQQEFFAAHRNLNLTVGDHFCRVTIGRDRYEWRPEEGKVFSVYPDELGITKPGFSVVGILPGAAPGKSFILVEEPSPKPST